MPLIGPLDQVTAGSLLRVEVDILGFLPSQAEIHSALSGVVNVVRVERGLFDNFRITVRLPETVRAGDIGTTIKETLERGFTRIIRADAVRYETLYGLPSDSKTPVTTTISLLSIAVIGLIGVYAYIQLR